MARNPAGGPLGFTPPAGQLSNIKKHTEMPTIYLIIMFAIVGGIIGFCLGGVLSYNRGFGDGWQVADDCNRKEIRKRFGLIDPIIPPGSICRDENSWAKFDGSETPESAQTGA